MKIRHGFVSNSSSSSFILVVDKELDIDLIDIHVKSVISISSLQSNIIENEDELDEYFKVEYEEEWTSDKYKEYREEDLVPQYRKLLAKINEGKGKKLVLGSVSNENDNPIEAILYEKGIPESESYEILEE